MTSRNTLREPTPLQRVGLAGSMTCTMTSLVYLNGSFVPKLDAKLSVYDHGLLYGDGVWEGMRLRDGEIPRLDEHLKNLFAATETISLTLPFDPTEMARII